MDYRTNWETGAGVTQGKIIKTTAATAPPVIRSHEVETTVKR